MKAFHMILIGIIKRIGFSGKYRTVSADRKNSRHKDLQTYEFSLGMNRCTVIISELYIINAFLV